MKRTDEGGGRRAGAVQRDACRRLLGDLPEAAGDPGEEVAWRRLQRALTESSPARPSPWRWALGGVALAGMAAALAISVRPAAVAPEGAPAAVAVARGASPTGRKSSVPESAAVKPSAPLLALIRESGTLAGASLANDRAVGAGARLSTSEGELRVELPDGSSALLERRSSLTLADLSPAATTLTLESGAVFVHASRRRTGALTVRAGAYEVVVHGTGFRVERRAGRIFVELWHGSVELRSAAALDGRFLLPGERLDLTEGSAPAAARISPLGPHAGLGRIEEARLLGTASPRPRAPLGLPEPPSPPVAPAGNSAAVRADVARCRAGSPSASSGAPLKLDLTLSNEGQVLSAAAERGATEPRFASCIAEAALHWRLDPPPQGLRGMQFVYPVPME